MHNTCICHILPPVKIFQFYLNLFYDDKNDNNARINIWQQCKDKNNNSAGK